LSRGKFPPHRKEAHGTQFVRDKQRTLSQSPPTPVPGRLYPVPEPMNSGNGDMYFDDVIDLELDDELFDSSPVPVTRNRTRAPSPPAASREGEDTKSKQPAAAWGSTDNFATSIQSISTTTSAATAATATTAAAAAGGAIRVSGVDSDLGGAGELRRSTPTDEALAAKARIVGERKSAAALGDGGGSGEVTGSMMGASADDDDDEDESSADDDKSSADDVDLEVFDDIAEVKVNKRASKPKPPARSPASTDAFGEDDIVFEMVEDDAAATAAAPKNKPATGDPAIDAIDAIAASAAEATATQLSLNKLTERFVDKFELEIDSESVLETGSSATTAGGAGDDEFEEEFGYAFEGGKREGRMHKHEFKAKPMPQNLVTNVKSMPMGALVRGARGREGSGDK